MKQPLRREIELAARLAVAMTARPNATPVGNKPWTVEDVLDVALANGLRDLEQRYFPETALTFLDEIEAIGRGAEDPDPDSFRPMA